MTSVPTDRGLAANHRQAVVRWPIAAVIACTLIVLTGCGNWNTAEINGAIAVKMDGSNSVRVLLKVCSGTVDKVLLFGPQTGPETKPDRPIGVWRASTPINRDTVLNIGNPGPIWEVQRDPRPLDPETTYYLLGVNGTEDQELTQVGFMPSQLEKLRPGQVRFNGRVIPKARFAHLDWCK